MAPSTLDLFMLTFNCAKNLINVAVFASHLRAALQQNATGLPDLVVFSLQEVAPLSYSFIGSYFLNPYYAAFEEALNQAAWEIEPPSSDTDGSTSPTTAPTSQTSSLWRRKQPSYPYQLVQAKNIGMTAIMLFARTPAAIHHIQTAECGFGAADMGNKGAVGLRITYADAGLDGIAEEGAERRTTEFTFVATHLAAMEWNLRRRNANWKSIVSGLTFANPKSIVPGFSSTTTTTGATPIVEAFGATDLPEPESDLDDAEPLLAQDPDTLSLAKEHNDSLRDISIFRPGGYLFVGGDLNYRISTMTPPALAPFPNLDAESENYWPNFLPRDQLTQERAAGRTLHGMSEADVSFPPTYKVVVMHHRDGAVNEAELLDDEQAGEKDPVPWRWATHRWPGWCDRILYLDLPAWVKRRLDTATAAAGVAIKAYDSLPVVRTSDHRPVFLRAQVPLLRPDEMGLPTEAEAEALLSESEVQEQLADPRLKLPVPIDMGAWDRRAAARRREIMVGWSMFLWSTREGAMVIATTVLLGVGAWWVYQGLW